MKAKFIDNLAALLEKVWDDGVTITVDGPTVGGIYFIDISRNNQHAVIEAYFDTDPPRYGLSIIDEDSGFGDGPDCCFGYVPTMLKYLKKLVP